MSEPVVVFRTRSDIEAYVVRGLLDAQGFHTLLSGVTPRSLFPVSVSALGELQIAVLAQEADDARTVIQDYQARAAVPRVVPIREEFAELESRLGYRFRDKGLLEQALTHRSHAQEDDSGAADDNESLEFLGDAVLGFVVADLIYREFPDYDEGQKSKIKAALVSKPALARIGARLALGDALILGRGEEKTGGRQKEALIADTCEALIAALYLDGGIEAARGFVTDQVQALIERAREPALLTAFTGDYKSALQEWLQSRGAPPPEYRLAGEAGPAHRKQFAVELWAEGRCVTGAEGRTKKEAEQRAARQALAEWGVETL
jgi:ribonuclease III